MRLDAECTVGSAPEHERLKVERVFVRPVGAALSKGGDENS